MWLSGCGGVVWVWLSSCGQGGAWGQVSVVECAFSSESPLRFLRKWHKLAGSVNISKGNNNTIQ